MTNDRFWEKIPLSEMTPQQWESLCDGCGKCCMIKLIDEETEEIHFTTAACRLFDENNCSCTNYDKRQNLVDDCVKLTPQTVLEIEWLPKTCAYRLIAQGEALYDWHPLISGNKTSTIDAGMSIRGRITCKETDLNHDGEYLDHLIEGEL